MTPSLNSINAINIYTTSRAISRYINQTIDLMYRIIIIGTGYLLILSCLKKKKLNINNIISKKKNYNH